MTRDLVVPSKKMFDSVRENNIELVYVFVVGMIFLIAPMLFYPIFLMKILCFALFACAYNLIFGYVGMLAFGHAAFFGSAAYVCAHAAKEWGVSPEVAILGGTAAATLLGAAVGWLAIRRKGLYFAMITLAMAQIVYFYFVQSSWVHGEDGIQSVPRGNLFGLIDLKDTTTMYFFVLCVFLVGFAIVVRAIYSPFGQVLKAIRDNEPRAISLGYDVDRFKLMAFTLSAGLSGLAGSVKALVFQLASLVDVHYMTSAEVLLMVLIGGIGTVLGPIVGSVIVVAMLDYLAGFGAWVLICQGAIYLGCVLCFRKGVVGTFAEVYVRFRYR